MAAISALGVGSNLDLTSLLDQLKTAEQAPLDAIDKRATSFQAKLSAFGQVQSVLTAYQAAAKKLGDATTFGAVKATVGSTDIMSVTTASNAVPGNYSITVKTLATAQSLVSGQIADQKAAIAGTSGEIVFDFGEALAADPTATPTSTKKVTIANNASLQDIRDAINKAGVGVTASIINDGSSTPYRLVLTSDKTGTQATMRVSSGSAALNNIVGFDPSATTNAMEQKVPPANATLKVNGIDIVSQSNAVVDAGQGLTMNLTKEGTTSLTVTRDYDSIKSSIQAFVTAYNNIQTTAKSLTAFDTSKQSSSPLTGDGTLRSIQMRLRSMLGGTMPDGNGGSISLADIGIKFDGKTGTMSVDDTKLTKALNNNLAGVTAMFSSTTGTGGIGKQVSGYVDGLSATNGSLKTAQDGITKTLKDLEKNYSDSQDRINTTMDRYKAQFTQLDLMVSQMNRTSSYLTQQFTALNNASSK
ncbi:MULTISPECIES: flagellar filament capping protein FliD [Cupriavidus]|uniref:Flagellar hook-associated protein 2 n=1 Tax=Cupriavidus pinatubonensis (strain JMP 134 / LMG 1197) TaxID=264198 RepID=Q46QZ5_CUPPJ|nr:MULTISPECIES: flagellar filament capping protein FliD [Cupriavidus]QYY27914.1 flagellar filament capping protein FliD [Cupriavidus pinatubonensis]TPQ41626.1 flagellar filament capping protein FliD [Cupriavidus pinatubonensis]